VQGIAISQELAYKVYIVFGKIDNNMGNRMEKGKAEKRPEIETKEIWYCDRQAGRLI